jgi:hypothetical protein
MPESNSTSSKPRKITSHTTVGLRQATKTRLDKNRAPGQCYDGFLCQLLDLWERQKKSG